MSRARAVRRFGERKTVGVIGQTDGPAQGALQIARERLAIQPDGIGILDQPALAADIARDGKADASAPAQLAFRIRHQAGDCRHRTGIVPHRGNATS